MGGEELKFSIFALLLAGLIVQIQSISAQEAFSPDISEQTVIEQNDPRAAEQGMSLGEGTVGASSSSGYSTWAAVRMILALALAAAAIYGVVFFIKRSSKQTAASDPFLKILASSHLGSNRYAHVVAVGNKAWLLGSSDGGVNLIGEIDDKDVINAMLLEDSRKIADVPAGRLPDFLSILRKMGAQPESRASAADDIRKRRERLKGM